MVVSTVDLPNIRKQFIPDPGMVIVDADLSGADAQVVAWEADDADMKAAFRAGMKIHCKNVRDMNPEWGDKTDDEIKAAPLYKQSKGLCHGTNYVGGAITIAAETSWPVPAVNDFQRRWFQKHPGIKEWHHRTERWLDGTQCWRCNKLCSPQPLCPHCGVVLGATIQNAFGYRIVFFDHLDRLLPEAVAWIPQSTVAIVTQRGMFLLEDEFPYCEILMQVHDSLVWQMPMEKLPQLPAIKKRLDSIEVPYPDPLRIPWGMVWSKENWGACD